MEFVFAVFEDHEPSLPYLKKEKERMEAALDLIKANSTDKIQDKVEDNLGLPKIMEQLTLFSNKITYFHLSSHHGHDYFPTSAGKATDESLIGILNNCQKLKLVFLNGCSTDAVIDQLVNVPIVIGTKVPVNDYFAQEVAGRFYELLLGDIKNLSEPEIIKESFERALAMARNFNELPEEDRGGQKIENIGDRIEKYTYEDRGGGQVKDYDIRVRYNLDASQYPVNTSLRGVIDRWCEENDRSRDDFPGAYPVVFIDQLRKLDPDDGTLNELNLDRYKVIRDLFLTLQLFLKHCAYGLVLELPDEGPTPPIKLRKEMGSNLKKSWDLPFNCHGNQQFLHRVFTFLRSIGHTGSILQDIISLLSKSSQLLESYAETFSKTMDDNVRAISQLLESESFLHFFISEFSFLTGYSFISVSRTEYYQTRFVKQQPSYESRTRYFTPDSKPDRSLYKIEKSSTRREKPDVYAVYLSHSSGRKDLNLTPFYYDFNSADLANQEIRFMYLKKFNPESRIVMYRSILSSEEEDIDMNGMKREHYETMSDRKNRDRIFLYFDAMLDHFLL